MSYVDLAYDDVRQKSCHNAFQRHEGIYDQVVYWRVRSLEIDLHRSKPFRSSLRGDWYVYHSVLDDFTSVDKLSGVLEICRGIQRAIPRHEVITLFLDIKDPFHVTASASQSWRALDRLLASRLGDDLYRPADLLARAPGASTLQEAVAASGWPSLADLRGKFLVVLTGPADDLGTYARTGAAAKRRMAFLSASMSSAGDVPGDPHIVFYNMDGEHVGLASHVRAAGFVSRAYYVDSPSRWRQAVDSRCHHIATDNVNAREDPWATTTGADGFPFRALDGPAPAVVEPGNVCGVWARSGDIWSDRDSFLFHFEECSSDRIDNTYELYVCNPNSAVDDWIKGGVVARSGLDPGSPYLGVFRVGEKHGIRVQYRVARNGPSTAIERRLAPEGRFESDTLVFVRLRITRDGHRARAWGSVRGRSWTEIGIYDFPVPLVFQGIGVSSHGQQRGAKFLFGVPRDRPRPRFDRTRFIGKRDPSDRGWVDWEGERRWRVSGFSGPERDPSRRQWPNRRSGRVW